MKKPKILQVSNFFPPNIIGGAEQFAFQLSKALQEEFDVFVVTTKDGQSRGVGKNNIDGLPVISYFPPNQYWNFEKIPRPVWQKAFWHLKDAWNTKSAEIFKTILQETKPDLVHTHNIDGFSPAIWKVIQDAGIPLIHTMHDGHLICPKANMNHENRSTDCGSIHCSLYRTWYRGVTGPVSVLVSPSHFLLQAHLMAKFHFKRSIVIPNGWLGDLAGKTDMEQPRRELLFLGRLDEIKGLKILIRALDFISPHLPFVLHIAGSGPLKDWLSARNHPKIQIHGFLEASAKEALLRQAHALIYPSICYENAPLGLLEGMSKGLVCIASNIGGIPEILGPGSPWLVEPNDAEALARSIERFLKLESKAWQIESQNSLERARQFHFSKTLQNYTHLYREVIHVQDDCNSS